MQQRNIPLLFLTVLLSVSCAQQSENTRVVSKTPAVVVMPVGINGLDGDEEQSVLSYHNQVRASVKVPPLSWSNELAQYAAKRAATLASQGCTLQHSKDLSYGENLFMHSSSQDDKHQAVIDAASSWESEKVNYSGETLHKANWSQAGHYTQMVWRNTSQLGCAKVACSDQLIVVCNYNPAGNKLGKKPY